MHLTVTSSSQVEDEKCVVVTYGDLEYRFSEKMARRVVLTLLANLNLVKNIRRGHIRMDWGESETPVFSYGARVDPGESSLD